MKIESNVEAGVVFHLIVVPHDLSSRSDKAVELAGTMAHPLRSEVVLINVIDPSNRRGKESVPFVGQIVDLARARWKFLQLAAKRLLPTDVKFEVRILSGDPQNVILTEARKLGADLLIITTHPVTGAGYPFNGGKAEHIMHEASCPVLTIQVSAEDEVSLAERGMKKFETHNLKQYCELSRQLAKESPNHSVYLGYSILPASPSGVCD